jgi:hypothetical protein
MTVLAICAGAALQGAGWEGASAFAIANPTGSPLTLMLTRFAAGAEGRVGWHDQEAVVELSQAGVKPPFAPGAGIPLGAGAVQALLLDNPGMMPGVEAHFLILGAGPSPVAQFRVRSEGKGSVCACEGFTPAPGWTGTAMGHCLVLGLAGPAAAPSSHATAAASAAVKPDPGARILSDQAILAEIAVLTQGMDLDNPPPNCGRLSLALLDFLATGRSRGGPVSTEPLADGLAEPSLHLGAIRIKREDGSAREIGLAYSRYDRAGDEDGRFEPPAGFMETEGGMKDFLDVSAGETGLRHLDWPKVPSLLAGELERVDQVAGTLTASRVNQHALDFMHEVVFDAHRIPGGHRIRFIDPQDPNRPIRERLEKVFDFVASAEADAIHGDSFAPEVTVRIAFRRRLAGAADPAPRASLPPGAGAAMETDDPGQETKARPQRLKRTRQEAFARLPGPAAQAHPAKPVAKRPRQAAGEAAASPSGEGASSHAPAPGPAATAAGSGAAALTEAERAFLAGGVAPVAEPHVLVTRYTVTIMDRATGATTVCTSAYEAARLVGIFENALKRRLKYGFRLDDTFLARCEEVRQKPGIPLTGPEQAFLAAGVSREASKSRSGKKVGTRMTIMDRATGATETYGSLTRAAQGTGWKSTLIDHRLKLGRPLPGDDFLVRYDAAP